eukprot:2856635-Amphidinium_carterae.3
MRPPRNFSRPTPSLLSGILPSPSIAQQKGQRQASQIHFLQGFIGSGTLSGFRDLGSYGFALFGFLGIKV